jgi:hypothetical protein
MIKYALIITLSLALSGCAGLTRSGGLLYEHGLQNKLASAVTLLEEGKTSAAEELLAAISADQGVPGVTDEALFRLSLLRLGPVQGKNGASQAQHDLERLQKEYPASSWTPLASALSDYLASEDDVRQQARKLKELNGALNKENRDLRQSIEKLKNLEMEMGTGTKR